jgi:thiol-disulfide isomerase/thioredoxin
MRMHRFGEVQQQRDQGGSATMRAINLPNDVSTSLPAATLRFLVLLVILALTPAPALLAQRPLVILAFTRTGCHDCQTMLPTIGQLVERGWVVRSIDMESQPSQVARWRVSHSPTLIVIDAGQEIDRIVGVQQLPHLLHRLGAPIPESALPPSTPTAPQEISFPQSQPLPFASTLVPLDPPPATRSNPSQVQLASATIPSAPLGQDPGQQPSRSRVTPPASSLEGSVVRLKIDDGASESFGTGTLIASQGDTYWILTCGHLFRDGQGKSPVTIETFGLGGGNSYQGEVVYYEADQLDLGLVRFRSPEPLMVAKLCHPRLPVQEGAPVFSYGCDHGQAPTRRDSRVTKLNRYLGPSNIEVAGAPVQGRSGGGLFNDRGELIGVCYAADPEWDEGLYTGPDVLHQTIERIGLAPIVRGSSPQPTTTARQPTRFAYVEGPDGQPRRIAIDEAPEAVRRWLLAQPADQPATMTR